MLEWEQDGVVHRLGQSMAIAEYLEDSHPEPALLPSDPVIRARTRQMCEVINAGTQPLQNNYVLQKLEREGGDPNAWAAHFIRRGLVALEALATDVAGSCLVGDAPTLADAFAIPQLFNARRFEVEIDDLPTVLRAERTCAELPAFRAAHASVQPDAESG